jgi:hypothetical protein
MAEADAALLVTDDNERGKAETLAALHHLGDAVDGDQLVDQFAFSALFRRGVAVAVIAARTTAWATRTTAAARATRATASAAAWTTATRAARTTSWAI